MRINFPTLEYPVIDIFLTISDAISCWAILGGSPDNKLITPDGTPHSLQISTCSITTPGVITSGLTITEQPAARAVEFGRGVNAGLMRGSKHNDKWGEDMSLDEGADGALGGMASGAPIHVRVTFKPPSGISKPQETFNQVTGMMEELAIKGRHDPVIAPRARPVVEAVARLVIADLGIQGGYIDG